MSKTQLIDTAHGATTAQRKKPRREKKHIGWREWVTLPGLGGARVKAKVDTGARTSAIHAWDIRVTTNSGQQLVHFELHPMQRDSGHVIKCTAPVVDIRPIRNSGGHAQERYVIKTTAQLGKCVWPIELSLTTRDEMGFRMLLGRAAVKNRFLVDPGRSFLSCDWGDT